MRFLNLTVVATTLLLASNAGATNIAGDYAGGGTTANFTNATGYWFTTNEAIDVTALGYYSNSGGGLTDVHNVGLFTAGGGELALALVPAGTAGTFIAGTVGGTWTVAIADTILSASTQYYILADNNTTDTFVFGGGVTYDPAITWNSYGDAPGTTVTSGIPSMPGGSLGNLGPNFAFGAIPEPGTAALMVSAAALLFGTRRWLRKV